MKRSGVTLLEVLVSIFIMGIGLLALLTLFPLGATTMAQAMKDARTGETAQNAKSVCFSQNVPHDPTYVLPYYYTGGGVAGGPTDLRTLTWNGPSYPVFVDPIGVCYITGLPSTLGATYPNNPTYLSPANTNIQRTVSSLASTGVNALRWYSLPDDYQFNPSSGSTVVNGTVERESRYTYAYLMRLPNINTPAIVDISAVVYAGRNLQVPGGETLYGAIPAAAGPRTVVLQYNGGVKPNIKRGNWILDVTNYWGTPYATQYGPVGGTFYQVIDMTDVAGPALEIELLTSLPTLPPMTNVMVLDGVTQVYPIGTGWKQ
jgi:prepilin-type N-terminal cleavage/methylation domain-containing protein